MALTSQRYRLLAAAHFKCRYCLDVYLPLVGSYTLTTHYLEEHDSSDAALAILSYLNGSDDEDTETR